jgi:hypothetical protein
MFPLRAQIHHPLLETIRQSALFLEFQDPLTSIEQPSNHVDATILDFSRLGILFVVDKVLWERFGHELLRFIFLFGCVSNVASVRAISPTM